MKPEHKSALAVFIVMLAIMLLGYCGMRKNHRAEVNAITNSAASLLQDTLEKVVSKRDTVWKVTVAELSPDEILKSDMYGELKYEQQLLLAELARYKNLVASMQTKFTGNKVDTITQYIRIPVLRPFHLSWLDTTGGFTYSDTVYVDSNMTRRVFLPKLQFTHDVRIIRNRKNEVTGEIRVLGLEEFDLVAQNIYSFQSKNSPAEIRRKKFGRACKIAGVVGLGALSYYAGIKSD